MEPLSAPKWEEVGLAAVAGHLYGVQDQSTTNYEFGIVQRRSFVMNILLFWFGRLPEEDTTADPILATGQHERQRPSPLL